MSTDTPIPDELASLIRESGLAMKARLGELAKQKDPGGSLLTSLNDEAMKWIGYIVSQWGMLEDQIETQIVWHSQHPAVPEELAKGTPRREFRQRLAHLGKLASATLANERPEALPAFQRNLSRIANFKQVRDHLVHGHYSLQD